MATIRHAKHHTGKSKIKRTGGDEAVQAGGGAIAVHVVDEVLDAGVEVDGDPALLEVLQDGLVKVGVGRALVCVFSKLNKTREGKVR